MKWPTFLWQWLRRLWLWGRRRGYRVIRIEELPERVRADVVYVVGEGDHVWSAAMVCPCGCHDVIHLNLLREVRPRWTFDEHGDGSVSLHPSVWRQKGCRSHFFVRAGAIVWCTPTVPSPSRR
jgi:hypothetical protein